MQKAIWAVLAAGALAGCSHTPEMQLVRASADAMGGLKHVEDVKTLTMEGTAEAPNLGQNVTPDGDLPVWKVTDFKRTIDVAGGRMREQQLRTAQFLFAGATVQRQSTGLDGDIAYNIGADDGEPRRASDATARERRIVLLHHPLTILRAALEPNAQVTNLRQEGSEESVDITTARGEKLTLTVHAVTKLPARVTSMSDNPNLGDVAIVTRFLDWQSVGSLRLPRRLITTIDKYPQFDLRVTRNTVDADGDLAAPAAVRSASAPPPPPVTVTAEPVGKGVWWLAGSGNHRSVVFEFDDHLTLFEVPLNEARAEAVIAKARSLRPDKPLTQAIVSHHHFDHSGGLRAAVTEGLTIITYRGNAEFFKDLVARPHTIAPDALAKHPQPLKLVTVDDELTLKDKALEVRLYHLKDNPREGTNLFAWVPRDRILVQADLYDSTWTQFPWADNVLANVKMRGLAVAEDVPVHGSVEPWTDAVKTMESKKTSGTP